MLLKQARWLIAVWFILTAAAALLVLTRPTPRTDRDVCNDNTNTTWRCDTEVVFVPTETDGGILHMHRETRDYCRCQRGW